MAQRTALVTGGNRGIGLEVCRQLQARGLRVVLAARDEAAGRAAAGELGVGFHRLDVSDGRSVATVGELGAVDVLVNNAGDYSRKGVLDESLDEFRRLMEVHAFAALALCQLVVPGMKTRGYGRVVNVSSGYGRYDATDGGGPAAYILSKLALGGVTRMVAAAAGPKVLVNAADPGWVRTRMGGAGAPRSVEEGADTIVWLATLPDDGPTGALFNKRKRVEW